jgi:hypothetical protein
MTITFNFEKLESTASSLYRTKAIDENNNIVMEWHIACDDESQLEVMAQQAYDELKNPKPIVIQEPVQPTKEQLLIELQDLKSRIEALEGAK